MDIDSDKTAKHDLVIQLRELFPNYEIKRNPYSGRIDLQFKTCYRSFTDEDIKIKLEIMKNLHDNFDILYEFLALNGFVTLRYIFTKCSGFFETKLTFMIDCCVAGIIDGYHDMNESYVFYNIDDVFNYLKPMLDTESRNKSVCK